MSKKCSASASSQVGKVVDLAHALGALQNGCGRRASCVNIEVHVTDKPFWWNNSLTDRDMSRVVASLPANVQVRSSLYAHEPIPCRMRGIANIEIYVAVLHA